MTACATPHKDYRKQAIGNGMQVRYFLNEHVREMNPFITIFLCFPYAKAEKVLVLTSNKDNFVIPCLTKEQVVQGIYQTTGSALNHERILAIKRALDELEEGMNEEN